MSAVGTSAAAGGTLSGLASSSVAVPPFGRSRRDYVLAPLRLRRLERVRLHAELTMLARLGQAARRGPCRSRLSSLAESPFEADNHSVLVAVLIGAGFTAGLALGRWWVLLACAGVGAWVGVTEELEVPGWFLGFAYGALSSLGVAGGVLLRRYLARLF